MRILKTGKWFITFRLFGVTYLIFQLHSYPRFGFVRPWARPWCKRWHIGWLEIEYANMKGAA